MRPGKSLKVFAQLLCLLVYGTTHARAQTQVQSPMVTKSSGNFAQENLSTSKAAPATAGLPAEMWHGANHGPSSQQPASGGRPTFRAQSGTSVPAEVRPSNSAQTATFGSVSHNSAAQAVASQNIDTRLTAVAPATYEAPRTPTRTPLPPKSKVDEAASPKAGGSTIQMLISLGSSLAIVIGLFLGVAVLYRKSVSTSLGRGLPKNVLQVLGKVSIAPRQQMLLVRFGSKLILISMIQGEARTISEITDPLEVDQLAGLCESHTVGSSANSFREILTQGAKV